MKSCYFTVGYIPAWDLKGVLQIMNWAADRNIDTMFLSQSVIQKPGNLSAANGAPNVEAVLIPYMRTTQENFLKVFGREWDIEKTQDIPAELQKLVKESSKIEFG